MVTSWRKDMNVQSALNAYKETNLSEVESASPHRLIELTFQDLKRNLLIVRRHLNEGKPVGGLEASKSMAALEILRTSLNFEDGGEIAANLDQIYAYSLDQISKIIKDDNEYELDAVIAIISSLVDAWGSISSIGKP
tara:strand:- start:191 stop:601 length:411 start_codon:yes stop_codon:yes gene_type:complete